MNQQETIQRLCKLVKFVVDNCSQFKNCEHDCFCGNNIFILHPHINEKIIEFIEEAVEDKITCPK